MKKTTISISIGLRNRIRHSRDVTFNRSYENFLTDLLDRDRIFSNEEKTYTNKENVEKEINEIRKQRNKLNRQISTLKKASIKA